MVILCMLCPCFFVHILLCAVCSSKFLEIWGLREPSLWAILAMFPGRCEKTVTCQRLHSKEGGGYYNLLVMSTQLTIELPSIINRGGVPWNLGWDGYQDL